MTTGSPTKLNPDIQSEIVRLLEIGVTIKDLCNAVGLAQRTFYGWRYRGEEVARQRQKLIDSGFDDTDPLVEVLSNDIYLAFLQAVTRGESKANVGAIVAIKSAIAGQTETTERTDTLTETRLRKETRSYVDEQGHLVKVVEEIAYDYTKILRSLTVTKLPPDWRAGMEYLRRRSPKEWAATQTDRSDFQEILVSMVKAEELSFADLEAEVGPEMALDIFQLAGKQVLRLNGG